jgi:hypothetical protein
VDDLYRIDALQNAYRTRFQSSLTAHLILLLHCVDLFPSSNDIRLRRPSIQFALVSALHLAAIAKRGKELYIAHKVLGKIFADQGQEEQLQTSLLLLNTTRQHLEATSSHISRSKGKGRQNDGGEKFDTFAIARTSLALKLIIAGVPAGPDIFPALYGPITKLCHHPDESIQRLALDALGKIYSYLEHDEGLARAIWERVHGLMKDYSSKQSGKSKESGDSFGRALLRAIKRAVDQGVISSQIACQSIITLIDTQHAPALSITCLEFCVDIAAGSILEQSTIEELCRLASEICIQLSNSYSILLSGARILGRLALINTATSAQHIKPVWNLLKSHISAKNANRKLLLLSALESFLPFSWFNAGNAAGVELEEAEMTDLLAMLGDKDESVRVKVCDHHRGTLC